MSSHGSHCCKYCGCKYSYGDDEECPVVLGFEEQEFPCGSMYTCTGGGAYDVQKYLWEILVPTVRRKDGKPLRTRFHRVWDSKVREMAGGLTVLSPVKGQWVSPDKELFSERMIPVRIACTEAQIDRIADMTAEYYDQLAVMYYRIADNVVLKHYGTEEEGKG